ncbi:hypothetical protein B0H12DRAFT_1241983 [Mycena haematopus]|nr:hypothetical protein B0H12DRAFT_1241983 [Mycena haematopus]
MSPSLASSPPSRPRLHLRPSLASVNSGPAREVVPLRKLLPDHPRLRPRDVWPSLHSAPRPTRPSERASSAQASSRGATPDLHSGPALRPCVTSADPSASSASSQSTLLSSPSVVSASPHARPAPLMTRWSSECSTRIRTLIRVSVCGRPTLVASG